MATFEVAYFRELGRDLIVVVVPRSFAGKTDTEQSDICARLQHCASSAGLTGMVVPCWDAGGGRMGYYAPAQWQPFFRKLTPADIALNINHRLTCS